MNLSTWNPFAEIDTLLRRGWPTRPGEEGGSQWRPAADISETKTEYLIKADLPDVAREDIELTVENGMITLSGERRYEKSEDDETAHRIEKFYGKFVRSFSLPDDVDTSDITAEQRNGVLTIHLPKTPKAQRTRIDVAVK